MKLTKQQLLWKFEFALHKFCLFACFDHPGAAQQANNNKTLTFYPLLTLFVSKQLSIYASHRHGAILDFNEGNK